MIDTRLDLQAQGVRFKVLAHVFPVLRHDVIGPISNAGLAAAMLHQPPDADSGPQSRQERLLDDVQTMLDEGVANLRALDDWLIDRERHGNAGIVFEDCRRLVAARLLATGKHVSLPQFTIVPDLGEFSARYIILAWMLCLLDTIADGAELSIEATSTHSWSATPGTQLAAPAWPGQVEAITCEELKILASASGWEADCTPEAWTLRCPQDH